jgi:hypothetical protein
VLGGTRTRLGGAGGRVQERDFVGSGTRACDVGGCLSGEEAVLDVRVLLIEWMEEAGGCKRLYIGLHNTSGLKTNPSLGLI